MGSSGNRILLVLTLVLLVISATITYIAINLQVTPVATGSTASGVVSLNILGSGAPASPSKNTGVVNIEILEPEST